MKFSRFNNPKKRKRKRMSRTDADIMAAKEVMKGDLTLAEAERMSDRLSGLPSRSLYKEGE